MVAGCGSKQWDRNEMYDEERLMAICYYKHTLLL